MGGMQRLKSVYSTHLAVHRSSHKTAAAPPSDSLSHNGWAWDFSLTADDNYLNLAYLLAKSSDCSGRVGCAIVRGVVDIAQRSPGTLVVCGANSSMYHGSAQSDCHAEANAVAESAANGLSLRGSACYVSKPPCRQCYSLLAVAGIARIIATKEMEPRLRTHAEGLGIALSIQQIPAERWGRLDRLAADARDMERVYELRRENKSSRGPLRAKIYGGVPRPPPH